MNTVFDTATRIATPIALAGFLAASFFLLMRTLIRKDIFPQLHTGHAKEIIEKIIDRFFILSLVAMVLGFAGYITAMIFKPLSNPSPSDTLHQGKRDSSPVFLDDSEPQPQPPASAPASSFVNVPAQRPAQVRVALTSPMPDDLYSIPGLKEAVDAIAPTIRECFADYTPSKTTTAVFDVNVLEVAGGNAEPLNRISVNFPNDTGLPNAEVEKMKNVICSAAFPTPKANGTNDMPADYGFKLTLTFVPSGN